VGLSPTYLGVGALNLNLFGEDMEYARWLIRAGVPTERHIYLGAFHGFPLMADASVSKAFTRAVMDALWRALHPQTASASTSAPGERPVPAS